MSPNAPSPLRRWIDHHPAGVQHDALIESLARRLERYAGPAQDLALRMLKALGPLSPDRSTIAAALAIAERARPHGEETDPREAIDDAQVRTLVEQFWRVVEFDRRYLPDSASRAEGLRRLILALIADVRVVLVVLAWQLARMQLAHNPEARRTLAHEARAIHAPLANRLGIGQLKWQLEDLAFRYLEPDKHARIERLLAEQRVERERTIEQFINELGARLDQAGIRHEISGRAKHIFSIWRKMARKGLDFHELFDVRAVRVLVDDLAACYSALGLIHGHWQPVPGEFDDYIANPKANLYRSLHTAVRVTSGRVFEVQIRTHEMHEHAEFGVAAHWRYKEGGPRDDALEQRIGVMRQLIEKGDDGRDNDNLVEAFESLTSEDRVYVLTPRGDVIDMAQGSTALDFAYHVHTEIGHRCRGAKVNGRIVPLTHVLTNGDRVEVLTATQPRPSRDWLNPQLGYLRSGRARGKVRHFFRQLHYDDNLAAGRAAVEAELRRLGVDAPDLAAIADDYHYRSADDMLAGIGAGDLTASQVAQAALRAQPGSTLPGDAIPMRRDRPQRSEASATEIRIEGVGNLLYQLANCCHPVPGDPIVGFITQSRGISIHRDDCGQYLGLADQQPERRIRADWSEHTQTRYPAQVRIDAWDRRELIKDIGSVLANQNLIVNSMQAGKSDQPEAVTIELSLEVEDLDQLSTLLGRLQVITNVTSVQRTR